MLFPSCVTTSGTELQETNMVTDCAHTSPCLDKLLPSLDDILKSVILFNPKSDLQLELILSWIPLIFLESLLLTRKELN